MTVPAGMKMFKFPSLAAKNVVQKQGDITVTLEGTEVDEQVWKVGLQVAYPEGGPAFESYRQGLFNNRLWLQKADGVASSSRTAASTTPGRTAARSSSNTCSSTPRASPPTTA